MVILWMVEHSSTPVLSKECDSRMDCCSLLLLCKGHGSVTLTLILSLSHTYRLFSVSFQIAHSPVVLQSQEVLSPLTLESGCQSVMGPSTWKPGHTLERAVPSREAAGSKAGKEHSGSKIQLTPTNQREMLVLLLQPSICSSDERLKWPENCDILSL